MRQKDLAAREHGRDGAASTHPAQPAVTVPLADHKEKKSQHFAGSFRTRAHPAASLRP